jgi:hypothetical protein
MLVIRSGDAGPQTIDLIDSHHLPQVADRIQLADLWAKLQAIFATSQLPGLRPRSVLTGQLIGAGSLSRVAAGMRGSAHHSQRLFYQHTNATFDLLIEPRKSSPGLSIMGQILLRNRKGRENGRLPVLLTCGMRNKARTTTNQFGEFSFECESAECAMEKTCVEVRLGEDSWVCLCIG